MTHLTNAQRLDILNRRLEAVNAWRDAIARPVSSWTFTAPGAEPVALGLGDAWPVVDQSVAGGPVRLEADVVVPPELAGRPLELELDLGGEGLVTVTGLAHPVSGGLNQYHRSFGLLERAAGGERLRLTVEAVPKGLFGEPVRAPRLASARLIAPEPEVRALVADLSAVLEAGYHLGVLEPVRDAGSAVIAAAEQAVALLDWPSGTREHLARLGAGVMGDAGRIWNLPEPLPEPEPLDEAALASVGRARARLAEGLLRARDLHPPAGRLAVTGHAHLDLAWLWPVAESRRKARRTMHTVLALMERYPEFHFNQSSAQQFAWLEADDPALFERVRERVAEGRLEPVGGMWVEPDCNMLGGESLARQLLFGQRYFRSRFGRTPSVAWLPDTFGFTPALPQLLRLASISGFLTTKLSWNETTAFPHDLFRWEGLDGSSVTAHLFYNPTGRAYNGILKANDVLNTYRRFGGRHLAAWGATSPESLFTFGHGDGGGGPTAEMLEAYERLREFPAVPRLRMSRVDEFFAGLPAEGLPTWTGELYLEYHRGTLTSQGRTKRLHRQAEHRLLEAEALAALAQLEGHSYPAARLSAAWEAGLLTQFHDILPGSSIREVYEDANEALGRAIADAISVRDAAIESLAGGRGDAGWWSVANPALEDRPLSVVLPGAAGAVLDTGGNPLPSQPVDGGLLVHAPARAVPALGMLGLRVTAGQSDPGAGGVAARAEAGGVVLENELLSVRIGPDGTIHRLLDKAAGREALEGRGNRLVAHHDLPGRYEAWDVNPDIQAGGEEILGVESLEILEPGPLRAAVRAARCWRGSRIEQTYRLGAGSRRLEIYTRLDWHERRTLVKAVFGLAERSHEAWFETAFGALARPTHRNMPHDAARFEVAGQRWADLSGPRYGVSILNDGRYGHTALGSTLSLTLVRGPMRPDPAADEGEHELSYAVFPHPGGWADGGTRVEAFDLNSPLVARPTASPPAMRPGPRLSGLAVALGSLKKAEDDDRLILRLYEPSGDRGRTRIEWPGLAAAERVSLLEDEPTALPLDGNAIELEVGPFEVLTLRLAFQES